MKTKNIIILLLCVIIFIVILGVYCVSKLNQPEETIEIIDTIATNENIEIIDNTKEITEVINDNFEDVTIGNKTLDLTQAQLILPSSVAYGRGYIRKFSAIENIENPTPFLEDSGSIEKVENELIIEEDINHSEVFTFEESFKITAYDLSYASCNKTTEHPHYGITASGYSLKGLSREEAMAVAVDPSVIPLGTSLKIEFTDENYKQYNGIYTAVDTGSAVKGNVVDVFLGDFESYEANASTLAFGVTQATITILS